MSELLVHEAFFAAASRNPDRVMATRHDRHLRYGEAANAVHRYARTLAKAGLGRGDRLVWRGKTSLELLPLYFATAAVGASFTPVNPASTDDEAKPVFELVDPRIVVTDGSHDGDFTIDELATSPGDGPDFEAAHEDDAHIMFLTSGTTGVPKGIEISHRMTLRRIRWGPSTASVGPYVCMFPLFHMSAWTSGTGNWLRGDEVVLCDGSDAAALMRAIEARRATNFYAIPAIWRRVLELDLSQFDLSSLRIANTGTSATPLALLEAIHQAFPRTTTMISYGSTEAGGVSNLAFEDIWRKPGSVGPPMADVEIRVEDDGALWVRSPTVFSGYFRNPAATADALVDGWFKTGELVEIDDDGYLYIVGRGTEMIRSGGEWIAPAEVDTAIIDHPALADAAVAGVADEDWGEIVTAFVVVRPGASITLEELQQHCVGRLTRHKMPRRLVVLDEIPRTGATRQAQRKVLARLA